MNIETLKMLINQGESETLEFKKSTAKLHAGFETVCAFLNGLGGSVLIGVNDSGKLIGQEISDATKREIAKEISKIEPTAQIEIKYIDVKQDKKVIVINVKAGEHAPYTYDHRPYQRSQSSTEKMSQHRYEQMIIGRGQLNHDWESFLNDASIDDLDPNEIKKTVSIAVDVNRLDSGSLQDSISEVLTKLELLKNGKVTNAAMVLFAKSVSPDFSQCMIKMARFKGTDELGDFIDNQMVSGNAFEIMKAANEFIMRHLPVASFFDESKLERVDKPLIPVLAIREALCNAVCHRDYSVHNASITLSIFDDRMEIWNNGSLVAPLTLEDLKKRHRSYPRNKKIAKVFYLRKYVETWGTGTTKMINLCKKYDVPEPTFNEYSGGFSVTFTFKAPIGGHTAETVELSYRERKLIEVLKNAKTPLSANDIFDALESDVSLRTVKADLNKLQQRNLIRKLGKARGTLWELV